MAKPKVPDNFVFRAVIENLDVPIRFVFILVLEHALERRPADV